MAEMKKIKLDAQKRRARLLAELLRTGWTITKLAEKRGMSRARMSQLINKAIDEQAFPEMYELEE